MLVKCTIVSREASGLCTGTAIAEVFYHPAFIVGEFGYGVGIAIATVSEGGDGALG